MRAAGRKAELTGKPVVVAAETTPTSEVTAHPDGRLSMTSNVLPVRVEVHRRWVPVSTRLRRLADGAWSALDLTEPVTFSGSGSGPLVTVTDSVSGDSVSLSWSSPLPKPQVSGSVALYRSVLPGVDLRLEATETGYDETLVVRNAAAAADPGLGSISFSVRSSAGTTVQRGAQGSLDIVDTASKHIVFVAGQPLMWQSSPARQRKRIAGNRFGMRVQQSATSANVNPALLTGGVPNSAYYSDIAQAVAATIARAQPPVGF